MPCYADTIVKIKYVHKTERNDSSLLVVWAVGVYPINCEDNEIEMVLFMLVNPDERDLETQAIFEKDGFYLVSGKIVPGFYEGNKRPKMPVSVSIGVSVLSKVGKSIKCSLKISLVGVPQETPRVVANDENAIFNTTIHPQESLIFVVRQLEVIDNDFYIYASVNNMRSKLLSTHRNIVENLKESSDADNLSSATLNRSRNKSEFSSFPSKNPEAEYFGESVDILDGVNNGNLHTDEAIDASELGQIDEVEGTKLGKRCRKTTVSSSKKRGRASHSLHSTSRASNSGHGVNIKSEQMH
ncbi:5406_t:CDS:2 [Cetraspora pellucida]|uniref:5406_t:CDS:1 n=1 Tax=Cetraspora pellucida TaxID=1433469 RepID=A0ACA9LPD2_9GLOM|nr:5406_t:CDS:2 [Cetraspora pellucida]